MDGKQLRQYRETYELTQAVLGDYLGIDASSISNWEAERRPITAENAKRIEAVFASLAAGKTPPKSPPRPHWSVLRNKERVPYVAAFIRAYVARNSAAPSLTEIRRGVGFPVMRVINYMEAQGLIERPISRKGNPRYRAIRLR